MNEALKLKLLNRKSTKTRLQYVVGRVELRVGISESLWVNTRMFRRPPTAAARVMVGPRDHSLVFKIAQLKDLQRRITCLARHWILPDLLGWKCVVILWSCDPELQYKVVPLASLFKADPTILQHTNNNRRDLNSDVEGEDNNMVYSTIL